MEIFSIIEYVLGSLSCALAICNLLVYLLQICRNEVLSHITSFRINLHLLVILQFLQNSLHASLMFSVASGILPYGTYSFVVFLNVTDYCYAASYLALLICWDNLYFSYHNWAASNASWRARITRNSRKLHFTFFALQLLILSCIIYFTVQNINEGMLISIPSMYLFSLPLTLYFFVFEYFQFRYEVSIASRFGAKERDSIQEGFHSKTRIALKRVGLITILILLSLVIRGGYVLDELLQYRSDAFKNIQVWWRYLGFELGLHFIPSILFIIVINEITKNQSKEVSTNFAPLLRESS